MQDLHAWWKETERNIRIVFSGDQVGVLFPDKQVRVAGATLGLNEAKLQQYAMTVITPIWHVLTLLEDVHERFKY